MESTEARQLARTMERAEAAPYIHYPRWPRLFSLAFGLWFAAILAAVTHNDGNLLVSAGLLALVVIELVYFAWYTRKHGAFPLPFKGNPPAEIARVFGEYFASWAVTLVVVELVWWQAGDWAAVGATFVCVSVLFWVHDIRYAAAADAAKERLA